MENLLFHGLFELPSTTPGAGPSTELGTRRLQLASRGTAPKAIPDPHTGRPLKVASVELSERGICPACTQLGAGGYVSFESDLRLAFACPSCRKLVWIAGA